MGPVTNRLFVGFVRALRAVPGQGEILETTPSREVLTRRGKPPRNIIVGTVHRFLDEKEGKITMIELSHLYDDGAAVQADKGIPMTYDPLKAYYKEISPYPVLSREEEFEVARLIYEQNDREAARKLALFNLKLVVKIALEYYTVYRNILDVIQEGNVGLLHAIKRFNPYKDTKFSTYAKFWIRAYILKHMLDSWSMVKVGNTRAERKLFYGLNRESQKLEALGLYPSSKRLSSSLGVKETEIEEMTQRLSHNDLSLDAPLYDGSDETILDTIAGEDDVEEIAIRNEESVAISKKIMKFRNGLDDKEALVFDRRILAEEPETLQEIGARLDISREGVRQIEMRIMRLLRGSLEEDREALGM